MSNTAVLFGITGGIGKEVAKGLLERNWKVIGASRNTKEMESLRKELDVRIEQIEAKDSASVNDFFREIQEDCDSENIALIHSLGSILLKPLHLTSDQEWQETLNQNLSSAFYAMRAFIKMKKKEQRASVVLFSSVAARIGLKNHEAIASAKAGLHGLALSASASYASQNLRVNVIAPGLVETPLSTASVLKSDAARKISEEMHPLGRIGKPRDISELAIFLAGPDSDWISGQIFSVDGGMSAIK